MKNTRKFTNVAVIVLLVFLVLFSVVKAAEYDSYDKEDEYDKYDKYDKEEYEIVKTEKVIVIEPQKTVYETQIQDIILPDLDRDGIADDYDPHPDIAEVYVVEDENRNGIVDIFEGLFG